MTWPFENDTSTIIKKLAKADLKEHKLKTLIDCNYYCNCDLPNGNRLFDFSK